MKFKTRPGSRTLVGAARTGNDAPPERVLGRNQAVLGIFAMVRFGAITRANYDNW
jgi:hypothetical protein